MTTLENLLDDKFPDDICDLLVQAVSKAYAGNLAIHDPGIGHDNMSLGLLIYKSNRHYLQDIADMDERVKVASNGSKFLINVNGVLVSPYRVGDTLDADTEASFPNNRAGAYALVSYNQQRSLFEFRPEGDVWTDDRLPAVILAHSGGFENGLTKIFIGVPTEVDDSRKITKWEACKVLMEFSLAKAATTAGSTSLPSHRDLAPSEDVVRPTLTLVTPSKAKEQ